MGSCANCPAINIATYYATVATLDDYGTPTDGRLCYDCYTDIVGESPFTRPSESERGAPDV